MQIRIIFKHKRFFKRRAQSQVITIVLLILLAIALVIIFWNFFRASMKNVEDEITIPTINVEVKHVYLNPGADNDIGTSDDILEVTVYRQIGKGELNGLEFILKHKNGMNYIADFFVDEWLMPDELETLTYKIRLNDVKPSLSDFSDIIEVSLVYLEKTNKGKDILRESLNPSESPSGSSYDGSTIVNKKEQILISIGNNAQYNWAGFGVVDWYSLACLDYILDVKDDWNINSLRLEVDSPIQINVPYNIWLGKGIDELREVLTPYKDNLFIWWALDPEGINKTVLGWDQPNFESLVADEAVKIKNELGWEPYWQYVNEPWNVPDAWGGKATINWQASLNYHNELNVKMIENGLSNKYIYNELVPTSDEFPNDPINNLLNNIDYVDIHSYSGFKTNPWLSDDIIGWMGSGNVYESVNELTLNNEDLTITASLYSNMWLGPSDLNISIGGKQIHYFYYPINEPKGYKNIIIQGVNASGKCKVDVMGGYDQWTSISVKKAGATNPDDYFRWRSGVEGVAEMCNRTGDKAIIDEIQRLKSLGKEVIIGESGYANYGAAQNGINQAFNFLCGYNYLNDAGSDIIHWHGSKCSDTDKPMYRVLNWFADVRESGNRTNVNIGVLNLYVLASKKQALLLNADKEREIKLTFPGSLSNVNVKVMYSKSGDPSTGWRIEDVNVKDLDFESSGNSVEFKMPLGSIVYVSSA